MEGTHSYAAAGDDTISVTIYDGPTGSSNSVVAGSMADVGLATPTVSVMDAGGTYNTLAFPATGASVTVGSDVIASFGSSSLSYAYYSGSYATVKDLMAANPAPLEQAPVTVGNYTVLATYAAARITQRPAEWTISQSARRRRR